MRAVAARVGQSLTVGNEGAGVVTKAGESEIAQALMGKTVAILGGAMYAQYRCMKANQCLLMHEGVTPAEGASCFVNPLTALGMVETMRVEGYTALVHTAAASNLGQMLNKICIADGVDLVNIVRKPEQSACEVRVSPAQVFRGFFKNKDRRPLFHGRQRRIQSRATRTYNDDIKIFGVVPHFSA